ncbi:CC0125/CC1285 family lipoprotein [Gayadomonas joobiniege]|uniref:CC0125/CC1285 family lipoprotein n=1 Tax=Gayadomonas joobiniege TaxID=1234606 RepID=UPI000375E0C1|nr:hypothetical protein [Gayadomonas joobiniege]
MKPLIVTMLIGVLLSACASKPPYRPAEGNGYGYKETQITNKKYRVQFKIRSEDKGAAMNFALLRAAEITKNNGFDWFTINDRQTLVDNQRINQGTGVSVGQTYGRRCGLLGCTDAGPSTSVGLSMDLSGNDSDIESILEITMGKGELPDSDNAYQAQEVYDNLLELTRQ